MHKKFAAVSALIVLVFGGLIYGKASAAGSGTIYISPSRQQFVTNSNFTVIIRENSGSTPVNAASITSNYDQAKLQYISSDYSHSAYEIQASSTGGSGTVNMDRGTANNNLTGDQEIGRITFKVLSATPTSVTIENASVVTKTSDSSDQVGTRTGASITPFEDRVAHRPNGQAFYFSFDKRYYIPNPTVRNCVMTRYNTGSDFLSSDSEILGLFTDGGQTAHCPYETELGLNFVREKSSPTVWKVNADGSKQHVGSLCVVDPYTTVLKKFHIFVVPDGETLGHVVGSDWFASGSNCAALPG